MTFKDLAALSFVATATLSSTAACEAADALPNSIQAQIPAGYEVMQSAAGPELGNKRTSFLVVVHHTVDTMQNASPRPLLIFESQDDGAFKLVARNDTVVLKADDGGQCDPFDEDDEGLAVKGEYFTVQNAVACGSHWSDFITFRYDAKTGRWLFQSEIHTMSFPLEGTPDKTSVTRADKAKPVSFADWKPER
jgi:hypothetical protein